MFVFSFKCFKGFSSWHVQPEIGEIISITDLTGVCVTDILAGLCWDFKLVTSEGNAESALSGVITCGWQNLCAQYTPLGKSTDCSETHPDTHKQCIHSHTASEQTIPSHQITMGRNAKPCSMFHHHNRSCRYLLKGWKSTPGWWQNTLVVPP